MNRIQINFREPYVDRFVEILATCFRLDFCIRGYIKNAPNGYLSFVLGIIPDPEWLKQLVDIAEQNADFICEYPKKLNFSRCFDVTLESIEAIAERIRSVQPIPDPTFKDSGCRALLKQACERLELNRDQLQKTIDLAYVIACMDKAKEIDACHAAEAIQYLPQMAKREG